MIRDSYIQWCNENEARAFPLEEGATLLSNTKQRLPDDVLVDLSVLTPEGYTNIHVTSVRVTPSLISIGIASTEGAIAVCTVSRTHMEPYRPVALVPMADNVSGWVTFGAHTTSVNRIYEFDSSTQSGLSPRALKFISAIPVTNLSLKSGMPGNYIEGIAKVLGGSGIRVFRHETEVMTVVLELDEERAESYLGPCNTATGDDGCLIAPICSISGVTPNEDGVITLRFTGNP